MGAKASKEKDEKLENNKIKVKSLFGIDGSDKTEITIHKVKEVWSKYVTPGLLEALIKTIFSDNRSYITFDDFFTFHCKIYYDNDSDIEARIFFELSKRMNDLTTQSLLWGHLLKVVSEFIYSYVNIINLQSEFALKDVIKSNETDTSVHLFATYLLKELSSRDTNDVIVIQSWLITFGFFRLISHNIYQTIFGTLDDVQLFPKLICKSNYDSHLQICDILLIRSNISPVYDWRLLYNMEYDGQSWATFLKTVIGQGPTVIVMCDKKGHCFGAFASKSWNINPNFYGDEGSFLFTLRPVMKIFEASGYNKNFQYVNTGQSTLPNGLGMGGTRGYWGLFIDADFGNGSVSESCTTFKEYSKPCFDKYFKIEKLEVWGVGEPDPTLEELGERSVSCLDNDPSAVAILELAGKPLHSTEIRKMKNVDDES